MTLPYFPFPDDTFKMSMGVQALDPDRLIEVDELHYAHEVALRCKLIEDAYDEYVVTPRETEHEQWEVVTLLLPTMARHYSHFFSLTTHGDIWTWHNRLLGITTTFRLHNTSSLPLAPLDWLGRQVQEDLLLLANVESLPLIAGHLCFPNDWCIQEKMGKSFLNIHAPVPLFASSLGRSSSLLLERLKVGRPVWRVNWAFKLTPQLTLTPTIMHALRETSLEGLTRENIGERCMLRVERQTLSRLPHTRAILFTVHTYQTLLASIASDVAKARRMANVIRTTPDEMLDYKGMTPFMDRLLAYLDDLV